MARAECTGCRPTAAAPRGKGERVIGRLTARRLVKGVPGGVAGGPGADRAASRWVRRTAPGVAGIGSSLTVNRPRRGLLRQRPAAVLAGFAGAGGLAGQYRRGAS